MGKKEKRSNKQKGIEKKERRKRAASAATNRKKESLSGSRRSKKRTETAGKRGPRITEEVVGRVALNREGYGFIIVPDRDSDIFVSASKLRGALNNDTVRVGVYRSRPVKGDLKHEGEVLEVLERSNKPHIGILQIVGSNAWVIVESRTMPYDIKVAGGDYTDEDNGKKVAILVTQWHRGEDYPVGKIVDVLGEPGDNNTEMHAILAEYGLPYKFPKEVEDAAAKIPVEIPKDEIKRRRDFRNTLTFTIDPFDAKDFDDALSLKQLDNGNWEVGVHIADVTNYVKPGDIVDKEAVERGTSVYLVDRTIPMLPEVLSNNLCSLRPNEEKLTYSAVFEMTDTGKVVNEWFGRTIINSCRRFAYEQAQKVIDSNGENIIEYEYRKVANDMGEMVDTPVPVVKKVTGRRVKGVRRSDKEVAIALLQLNKLATILRKERFEEGSISFERPEMKVIVDANGKPVDVKQKITSQANWLIEEFMLLANRKVAEFVTKKMRIKEPTFVYRVHDKPDTDKIQQLRNFIKHFGYHLAPASNPHELALALNKLLDSIKDKPEAGPVEILALRSMARAKYTTDNIGHYGLGFAYYTHFTSPIRRLPDMMVHRLLTHYLDKGRSVNKEEYEELCKQASAREQVATEAERSSIKYKMAEYMQERIGEEYDGTISGLTEWGMYVEADPTKIEGMVMLRNIKEDYFIYDEETFSLIGKDTHKRFTLGDRVRVKVARVNLEQKLIDYELVWDPAQDKKTSKGKGTAKSKKVAGGKGTAGGKKPGESKGNAGGKGTAKSKSSSKSTNSSKSTKSNNR